MLDIINFSSLWSKQYEIFIQCTCTITIICYGIIHQERITMGAVPKLSYTYTDIQMHVKSQRLSISPRIVC